MQTMGQYSDEQKDMIAGAIDKLVASVGPDDARVTALGTDRSPAAIQHLLHAVLSDEGSRPREVTLSMWLACVYPNPALATDIVRILRRQPALAMLAGERLSQMRDGASVGAVEEILLDPTLASACRAGAARALIWLSEVRSMAPLRLALQVPGEGVTVLNEVIQTLAWIHVRSGGRSDVATDIAAFLNSDSPDIRYSAILAFGNMGATEMRGPLSALVHDDGITSSGRAVRDEALRVTQLLNDTRRRRDGIE